MFKIIPVEALQVGMYVARTGLSWEEKPYLYAIEGAIEHPSEVAAIRADGFLEVVIDTTRGLDVAESHGRAVEELCQSLRASHVACRWDTPMEMELARARAVHEEAMRFSADAIRCVRHGQPVDVRAAAPLVESMAESLTRNGDALFCLAKLRGTDDFTYGHSVSVAVLALYLGIHLRLPGGALQALGIAALLHDIGKADIPLKILKKPGKLTQPEFEVIKGHVAKGQDILKGCGLGADILAGVAQHHERASGRGYPHGLPLAEISPQGRIIGVVDVFDALTSARPYKPAMPPGEALKLMYSMRGTDFDDQLLERFIKALGVYPLGSVVLLSDGRMGVVSAAGTGQPLRPRVLLIRDADGQPHAPAELDLTRTPDLHVARCLEPEEAGVNPMAVLTERMGYKP